MCSTRRLPSNGPPSTTRTCAMRGLGRAAAGDASPEVVYHLYRTSQLSLFREQRRLGLPPRALSGRFQTGLYLDYPLSSRTEMWLAYAASMIETKDFDEGEQVLDELDTPARGHTRPRRGVRRNLLLSARDPAFHHPAMARCAYRTEQFGVVHR